MTDTTVTIAAPMRTNYKHLTDTDQTLPDGYVNQTPQDGHIDLTMPTPATHTSTNNTAIWDKLQQTPTTFPTVDKSHSATKIS
jgi:predicted RNA-binding protein (virulence factor B family)